MGALCLDESVNFFALGIYAAEQFEGVAPGFGWRIETLFKDLKSIAVIQLRVEFLLKEHLQR